MNNNSSVRRKKIPSDIESRVLINSRRRCCLCFYLEGDLEEKKGQIAHIDHKRNNNHESNLAFLCFKHHDEYDSKSSQSKGITHKELQYAKELLHQEIGKFFNTESSSSVGRAQVKITFEADFDKMQPEDRHNLINSIIDLTKIKGEITILNIERGSIKLTIEVDFEDAEKIYQEYSNGNLKEVGIIDVRPAQNILKKNIKFSKSFKTYHHGITKWQATDIILNPDSVSFFAGNKYTSPESSHYGLYLKRISSKYSVLIVTFMASTIHSAYPINHSYLKVPKGSDPLGILKKFLNVFGIEIDLTDKSNLLHTGIHIQLPVYVSSKSKLIKYLEECVEKNDEKYELVCIMEKGVIISNTIQLQLIFAISKNRYYSSLRDIRMKFDEGYLGRHITWKKSSKK